MRSVLLRSGRRQGTYSKPHVGHAFVEQHGRVTFAHGGARKFTFHTGHGGLVVLKIVIWWCFKFCLNFKLLKIWPHRDDLMYKREPQVWTMMMKHWARWQPKCADHWNFRQLATRHFRAKLAAGRNGQPRGRWRRKTKWADGEWLALQAIGEFRCFPVRQVYHFYSLYK